MDIRQTLRYLGAPIGAKSFLFGNNTSWIQSAYNLSDMLSKHWDHPTVYPMILKLLISRGNITVIPKEATQEKRKENLKSQPEKLKKKEKEE